MKKILSLTFLAALLGAAGCSSSSPPPPIPDTPSPPPETAQVQVIHAVADAPSVVVSVGGPPPAGSELDGLEFKNAASGEFTPGTFDVSVDANLPDGTTVNVIPATSLDFVVDTRTIIVATGAVGGITPVVLTQDVADFAALGEAALRVVHAAVGVDAVDVYATAPDADLAASMPIATLAFQQGSELLTVPPGDYQLRVTPAGDPATVVFDAGTTTLLGGEDLIAVAVNNTTSSTSSPITVVVANSTDGEVADVQDVDGETTLRAVHASPDAGPVDILANDAVAVAGAVYTNAAELAGLASGTYDIEIRPAGGDETTTVFQADLDLAAGAYTDAIAIGSVLAPADDPTEFTVLVANDDRRRIATEAKVRLIHGSVSAGEVDVYVVPTGTDVTTVDPTAAGVVLGDNTGFLSLTPAVYDVVVTVAGDATMVALGSTIDVAATSVSTAVVIDDPVVADAVTVILLDDFTPAPPAP
jgi:hypothetical protein